MNPMRLFEHAFYPLKGDMDGNHRNDPVLPSGRYDEVFNAKSDLVHGDTVAGKIDHFTAFIGVLVDCCEASTRPFPINSRCGNHSIAA